MSTLYICQQCGGSLDILENGLGECQYCGVLQTLPIDQSNETKNILNRAIEFRLNCDFDRAIYEYEKVLELNETEPEAHWGMFLSKYGVEYVKDPITYVYKPTLHRISSISVFDDIDYKATLKYALPSQISCYKKQAEEIETVMKELLMMSANQEPYDIFLSYKEADDVTRKRTDDSYLAHDLYNELTAQGYKVFFAPKSLGVGLYEPKIYSAIISSKIMIVLGTKAEYFNAVWVKNEWSRYAEMIDRGEPKEIIPVYKNMEVDKLPYKLTRYQAYDMSSISFLPMLLDTISTIVSKTKTKIKFNKDVSAEDNFIERGRLALEVGNFTEADRYIESALNINAHNSQAYFYKLMIEMRITKQEYISTSTKYLKEYINFERAVNFADHELKMTLLKYEEQVKKSLDTQNYSVLINSLKDASSKENLVEISEKLKKYKHIDQSNNFIEKIDNCIKEVSFYEEEKISLNNQLLDCTEKANKLSKFSDKMIPFFTILAIISSIVIVIDSFFFGNILFEKPKDGFEAFLGIILFAICIPILVWICYKIDCSFVINSLVDIIRDQNPKLKKEKNQIKELNAALNQTKNAINSLFENLKSQVKL